MLPLTRSVFRLLFMIIIIIVLPTYNAWIIVKLAVKELDQYLLSVLLANELKPSSQNKRNGRGGRQQAHRVL